MYCRLRCDLILADSITRSVSWLVFSSSRVLFTRTRLSTLTSGEFALKMVGKTFLSTGNSDFHVEGKSRSIGRQKFLFSTRFLQFFSSFFFTSYFRHFKVLCFAVFDDKIIKIAFNLHSTLISRSSCTTSVYFHNAFIVSVEI